MQAVEGEVLSESNLLQTLHQHGLALSADDLHTLRNFIKPAAAAASASAAAAAAAADDRHQSSALGESCLQWPMIDGRYIVDVCGWNTTLMEKNDSSKGLFFVAGSEVNGLVRTTKDEVVVAKPAATVSLTLSNGQVLFCRWCISSRKKSLILQWSLVDY